MTNEKLNELEIMGTQLRKLRKNADLSQEKFAETFGVSRDIIYRYEKGKTSIPHDLIKRICMEFNISADYFYFCSDRELRSGSEKGIDDMYLNELNKCNDLEKKQLLQMLNILRMKP